MSINIHIYCKGQVTAANGKSMRFSEHFECNQTSSKTTEEILKSKNPIQAYKDWIISMFDEYSLDDHYGEFLIAFNSNVYSYLGWNGEIYEELKDEFEKWKKENPYKSPAQKHIKELDEFIHKYEDLGFDIVVEGW